MQNTALAFVLLLFATCNLGVVKGDQDEDSSIAITYEEIYRVTIFLIAVHYMGHLCTLFKMPALIGQLVTGVILGPPLTGFVPIEKGLVMLGEIGLIFNMFEVGIELDVALLRKTGTRAILMSFLGAALTVSVGIGVGIIFGLSFQGAFALGCVFAQTASGTLFPLLKSGKLINTPVGQMILAATVIDDLITLILLSVMEVFGPGEGISMFEYFIPVLSSVAWIVVLGMIAISLAPRLIKNYILPKIARQDSKHFVLFVMMCAIYAAYLPLLHYTRTSYLTGAFLCGATFSQVDVARDIFFQKSQGFIDWGYKLYFSARLGFLVPIKLFVNPSVWILGLVLVSTVVAIKFACALIVPKFQRVEKGALYNPHRQDQIVAGLSMMNRGGFGFLVASFAVDGEIIDMDTYASAIIALLFGIFVPAYLLSFAIRRYEKIRLKAKKDSNPRSFKNRRASVDGMAPFFVQIHLETKGAWGLLEKIVYDMNTIGLQVENFNTKHRRGYDPVIINDLYLRDRTMRVMISNSLVKSRKLEINSLRGKNRISRNSIMMGKVSNELSVIEKRCNEINTLVQEKIKQFKPMVVEVAQWDPYDVDNALDTMLLTRADGEEPSLEFFRNFFTLMDKDGDGFVAMDDLKRGLMDANFEMSDEGFAILMRSLDFDENGMISFSDWSNTVELYLEKKMQQLNTRFVSNRNLFRKESVYSLLPDDEERKSLQHNDNHISIDKRSLDDGLSHA